MAPSTEYIVLDLLCPSLGVVLATLTFAAPVRSLRDRLSAEGSLGHLNPTPWAVMTGNCLGWIGYSYLTGDLFVLMANVPGLLVSVWLNVGACKLQYRTMYGEYEAQLRSRHHRLDAANNSDGGAVLPAPNGASRDDCSDVVGANDANSDNWTNSDHEYEHEHDDIDEEEIDTLGGLVFMLAGRVPARGEVVKHPDGPDFEVVDADPRRIKRLRVRVNAARQAAE